MLFEAIGAEWARDTALRPTGLQATAERLVRDAPDDSASDQWAAYYHEHAADLYRCWKDLVALARADILASRDVERAGRLLASIGHFTAEGEAEGHFLIGFACHLSDQGVRHLELAQVAYRDFGRETAAALAEVAAEAARFFDVRNLLGGRRFDGLDRAFRLLHAAEPAGSERMVSALGHFKAVVQLTRDVIDGRELPSGSFRVQGSELSLVRNAMVVMAIRGRPERVAPVARWIQQLQGLPQTSTVELDSMVEMLTDMHEWRSLAVLAQDMVDHGDHRELTVIRLANALVELGRWQEAKRALLARIGARPGPEHVRLLEVLVALGYAEQDPDMMRWVQMLSAVGGSIEGIVGPPSQIAEVAGAPSEQILASYNKADGTLTIDPSISPGQVQAHMMAAMIQGLDADEGAELLKGISLEEPALYAQVVELLPRTARIPAAAERHMRAGEQFFRARRYDEALQEYEAALAADPDLEYAELCIGDCHYRQGRYQLALVHFTESIAIRPTPQAWRFLGDCQCEVHDLRRAKECYEEALRLDPAYCGARDMLQQVNRMLGEGGSNAR